MSKRMVLALFLSVLAALTLAGCSWMGGAANPPGDQTANQNKEDKPMEVLHLTSASFDAEVLQADKPVLVDFWAAWCGPCRMVAPVVEAVATENAGALKVGKVNVDEESALASKYGIRSIPTLILFKNGQKVDQFIGYMDKETLSAKIRPHLAGN